MSGTGSKIVFQGEPGAYSHLACQIYFPDRIAVPCSTFEDAFEAMEAGEADCGMIPIENSVVGRVADIHHLLPDVRLFVTGEHFLPVHHQLLAKKGSVLEDIKTVHSHAMALGQCRRNLRRLNLKPIVAADTAGAARIIAHSDDKTRGAIASSLAAEIYGLDIIKTNIEDADHNTTRFLVLAREPAWPATGNGPVMTSFLFRVRNVPAALYKALGGFATNGVNITKLESYQLDGTFRATQFFADIQGHPDEQSVQLALEELDFFSTHLKIIGTYPADPYRLTINHDDGAAP